jgi:hypothetical protein
MRQTTLDELENLYDWLGVARLAARTRAPARLTLRCAAGRACGATISALPRSVGDRKHHACVLDEAGEVLAEEVITNTREVVTAFGARYPGATCVMETGTHSMSPSNRCTASAGSLMRWCRTASPRWSAKAL